MWALERQSSGVVLARRRPARAVTLAGVLGAMLSLVPLAIAPDPGFLRLVTFTVLAVSSGALVFLGRSRPERVELVQKPGGVVWGDEPLPPPAYVTLKGDATEEPPAYRALVGWADGRERLALEGDEPGGVLADAIEVSKRLGLDLRPGWGLEGHFAGTALREAWEALLEEPSAAHPTPSASVDLPVWPAQQNTAAIAFSSGIFVLVVTTFLAESPERSVSPSAFALVLPGLAASLGLALGTLLFGIRRRVELGARGVATTLCFFGKTLGKTTTLAPDARRVFGVAPAGGAIRHALFATSAGPIAVPADAAGVARLVVPSASPELQERAHAELPRPTSSRYRGPDRPARLRS